MVGVITLSPSQRGAYEPASCLRGSVTDTPARGNPGVVGLRPTARGAKRLPVHGGEDVINHIDQFVDRDIELDWWFGYRPTEVAYSPVDDERIIPC